MILVRFRFAAFAVGAAALAGCTYEPHYPIEPGQQRGEGAGVVAPHYPIQENPSAPPPSYAAVPVNAPPPPPPGDDGPSPRAAPSSRIDTQPLNAPSGQRDAVAPPSATALGYHPSPYSPVLLGEVQVQPFESLYDVAERVRTPIRALIDLNGLHPPYTLAPGTVLKVPPPVVYKVAAGDTLFGVSRRFSIDPRSLANLNELPLEAHLKPGQRLSLPSLVKDKGPVAEAEGGAPEGLAAAARFAAAPKPGAQDRSPYAPGAYERNSEAASAKLAAAAASDVEVFNLGKGRFAWPLTGEVLSGFGPKGPGQRNDGVNIAASTGASIKAAAGGTVVYAGNGIPAFGNLVLIKHPGGWATLYGNLGKITVTNNAQVSQGQEVGTAGLSGAVDRPQIHFEIRYAQDPHDKAKPYDPAGILPPAAG